MKTNQQVAAEVLMGKWGNGNERRRRLTEAGYNYDAVQGIVNALVEGTAIPNEPEQGEIEITGTETLEIELDITKYNSIAITLLNGGE